MSKTEDREDRKATARAVDAKLRLLLAEIESCPVPPRIQELAKELQDALERRADRQ